MTKILVSLVALAALSTASFADRNREDFSRSNGGVTIESAALAVYGSGPASTYDNDHQGSRGR